MRQGWLRKRPWGYARDPAGRCGSPETRQPEPAVAATTAHYWWPARAAARQVAHRRALRCGTQGGRCSCLLRSGCYVPAADADAGVPARNRLVIDRFVSTAQRGAVCYQPGADFFGTVACGVNFL